MRHLKSLGEGLARGHEAELKISLDPLIQWEIVNRMLELVNQSSQYCSLRFKTHLLKDGLMLLKQREIDFCLGIGDENIQDRDFEAIEVGETHLVPVVHEDLISEKSVDKELYQLPQIVFSSDVWANEINSSNRQWLVSEHGLKESLILGGFGWGRLPREVFEREPKLMEIPSELVPGRHLKFFFVRNRTKSLGLVGQKIWQEFILSNPHQKE